MDTYIATIAVPAGWFAGDKIIQFEFEHKKGSTPTHADIMFAARGQKRYTNVRAITAIKK